MQLRASSSNYVEVVSVAVGECYLLLCEGLVSIKLPVDEVVCVVRG